MKITGYTLITVAFLAGAYFAVLPPYPLPVAGDDANQVPWGRVGSMLLLGAIGVALARRGSAAETQHEGTLTSNIEAVNRSLESIVTKVTRLDGEKKDLHPFDVHPRIDALFPEDLNTFVQARQSIAHLYGLQAYAAVMNEFAAGERYLNRVWSASVDCYIDDVREYLGRAREQFVRAREVLRSVEQRADGS